MVLRLSGPPKAAASDSSFLRQALRSGQAAADNSARVVPLMVQRDVNPRQPSPIGFHPTGVPDRSLPDRDTNLVQGYCS